MLKFIRIAMLSGITISYYQNFKHIFEFKFTKISKNEIYFTFTAKILIKQNRFDLFCSIENSI